MTIMAVFASGIASKVTWGWLSPLMTTFWPLIAVTAQLPRSGAICASSYEDMLEITGVVFTVELESDAVTPDFFTMPQATD